MILLLICDLFNLRHCNNLWYLFNLWKAASGHLHYNKKHAVSCFLSLSTVIIHQFLSYTNILTLFSSFPPPVPRIPTLIPIISTLIPHISTLIPCIPTLIPVIASLIPCIPTLIPIIPTMIPRITTLIPHIPSLILRIPTPIPRIPTMIPRIPTLIPRVPIIPFIPFPDSPFRVLKIASTIC